MSGRYILITAAKNEGKHISEAINSVLRQSVLPLAWFIVDDGSTDRTATIIAEFAAKHSFIRLHSRGVGENRNFGAQYRAIAAAYAIASPLEFEFVGVQDADIAPARDDYYDSMLEKFREDDRLGIIGGYVYERSRQGWCCRKGNSPDSVAGGIQMFRRSCYEKIGGYTPLSLGGSDWLAQIDARMIGAKVQAFTDFAVYHYRPTSSSGGRLRGWFREGQLAASFGSHAGFELLKCMRRFSMPPFAVGSLTRFLGYLVWSMKHDPILPPEKVAFLRRQQLAKATDRVRVSILNLGSVLVKPFNGLLRAILRQNS